MNCRHSLMWISLLFFTLTMGGCSVVGKRVSAFERNFLSLNAMQLTSQPLLGSQTQHMLNAREGSIGGFGGAGGGCGCN